MPIRLSFIQATWHCHLMWSHSIRSVNVSGVPRGLTTSRQAPETETFRTTQLIESLSNAIKPAFRVRRRTFFRFSDMARGFDAGAIKKNKSSTMSRTRRQFEVKYSVESLLKSVHVRIYPTGCP